jgi:hypothetical protein
MLARIYLEAREILWQEHAILWATNLSKSCRVECLFNFPQSKALLHLTFSLNHSKLFQVSNLSVKFLPLKIFIGLEFKSTILHKTLNGSSTSLETNIFIQNRRLTHMQSCSCCNISHSWTILHLLPWLTNYMGKNLTLGIIMMIKGKVLLVLN